MKTDEKVKKIITVVLLLAASGFFLYSGFSLLFLDKGDAPSSQVNNKF